MADTFRSTDAAEEIRQFLSNITLEHCFNRKLCQEFKFFALVRLERDILPVRTIYNGTTQNIGINYLTSKDRSGLRDRHHRLYSPDRGKIPHIEKAICVVPDGKQAGLGSTFLRSMVRVDASTDGFFKHVIEQRAASESNAALRYWLKILANSGSYGLFVELNPNESEATKLKVLSGEESFETASDVVKKPGKWFAPHIGSLITSGGRLLLGMLEKHIADAGGAYLFCDTDSATIVSSKHRQQIAMSDGKAIRALSWAEVHDIVDRFASLNLAIPAKRERGYVWVRHPSFLRFDLACVYAGSMAMTHVLPASFHTHTHIDQHE